MRHLTIFHLFLVRLAIGFLLNLQFKLKERERIDGGQPVAAAVFGLTDCGHQEIELERHPRKSVASLTFPSCHDE